MLRPGPQRGSVPVREVRDLLQVEEGLRRPHPDPALAQARRDRREAQVQEGAGRPKQGDPLKQLLLALLTQSSVFSYYF